MGRTAYVVSMELVNLCFSFLRSDTVQKSSILELVLQFLQKHRVSAEFLDKNVASDYLSRMNTDLSKLGRMSCRKLTFQDIFRFWHSLHSFRESLSQLVWLEIAVCRFWCHIPSNELFDYPARIEAVKLVKVGKFSILESLRRQHVLTGSISATRPRRVNFLLPPPARFRSATFDDCSFARSVKSAYLSSSHASASLAASTLWMAVPFGKASTWSSK